MNLDRRQFLKYLSGAAALVAIGRWSALPALAADKKASKKSADAPLPAGKNAVPADDAVATAIGYVTSAAAVDKKKYPQYKAGQDCSKCALYTSEGEGWGKCQMIMSGLVKSGGWCGSFSPKA